MPRIQRPSVFALIAVLIVFGGRQVMAAAVSAEASPGVALTAEQMATTPEGRALHAAWVKAAFGFTPEVRDAYLALAKAHTLADLKAAGESVPDDFLAWIDGDPLVASSVYGIKDKPANVLRILRSLELDLGVDVVRKEYTQLALAMAVSNAEARDFDALGVSLAPRDKPFALVIPECPLKPVNTKDPNRELDVNDHIINFLNAKPFEYEVKVPAKEKGGQPTVEKRTRPMRGADVLLSEELTETFNAYMAAHGHDEVKLVCERPNPTQWSKNGCANFAKGFRLFRDAYQAKGLLPLRRDPTPTLAESTAWLIRNDRFRFPEGSDRKWPVFPLKAPWPVLTFLALDRQPLRELEDIWQRWVATGRATEHGVAYVGWIAQKPELLHGRSVAPLDFYYGSVQMMVHEGGVCGAQSTTAIRTQLALGRPACTTHSPTHCGMSGIRYNAETNTYAGAGNNGSIAWVFRSPAIPRPAGRYHESVGYAVNWGAESFADSLMAGRLYTLLSDDDRAAHGLTLIRSGLEINPYNVLLEDAAASLDTLTQVRLTKQVEALQAKAEKPGCPVNALQLYGLVNASALRGPLPEDKAACKEVYAYLEGFKGADATASARYQVAAEGLADLLTETDQALAEHLAARRTPATCRAMAETLKVAAARIPDDAQRKAWLAKFRQPLVENPTYDEGGRYHRELIDDTLITSYELAGETPPTDAELLRPEFEKVFAALDADRAKPDRRVYTAQIGRAVMLIRQLADLDQRRRLANETIAAIGDTPAYQYIVPFMQKSCWALVSASRQGRGGPAAYAFDGNDGSAWHTSGGATSQGGLPQEFVVDMTFPTVIEGFSYMPRYKYAAGLVDACSFYTSLDGEHWTLATDAKFDELGSQAGTRVDPTKALKTVSFAPALARYFRFVATHVVEQDHAAVAEVGVIESRDAAVVKRATQAAYQPTLDALGKRWRDTVAGKFDRNALIKVGAEIAEVIPTIPDVEQREQWRGELVAAVADKPQLKPYGRCIAKAGWKVIDVSYEAPRSEAFRALDGNRATIWHTSSATDDGRLPQHVSVDMGAVKTLIGFTVMPRVNYKAGMVDACSFYTSLDGEHWTLAVEAKFGPELAAIRDPEQAERRVECAPVQARYFKFVATSAMAGDHAVVTELGVIESNEGE
ncbi:MAG: hypothetical protein GC159_14810 [Phycisphaera sp.]|nr:hypothetical protein [Phycisphaera sp.]